MITSLKPRKSSATGRAGSPTAISPTPKARAKRIRGSSLVSAAAATRLGGRMASMKASAPAPSLPAMVSGSSPAVSRPTLAPGWIRFTTTSPISTATAVVDR